MGLRSPTIPKRSTTAEDGDMALALALQQSEMHSAEKHAASAPHPVSVHVQASPVPSFSCGGSGNFQAHPNVVQSSPVTSFTCGGSGNFESQAPQIWHNTGQSWCTSVTGCVCDHAKLKFLQLHALQRQHHLRQVLLNLHSGLIRIGSLSALSVASSVMSNTLRYDVQHPQLYVHCTVTDKISACLQHLPRVNSHPPTPEDSSTARARYVQLLKVIISIHSLRMYAAYMPIHRLSVMQVAITLGYVWSV